MSKTLVAPKHDPGVHENGFDGCFARWAEHGCCPGAKLADWLNNLGPDNGTYLEYRSGPAKGHVITNGEVRSNYIRGNLHVVPVVPRQGQLLSEKVRLERELRRVKAELKVIEGAVARLG